MRVALTTCRQFILRDKQSLFSLGAANYTVESHVAMCALMICLLTLLGVTMKAEGYSVAAVCSRFEFWLAFVSSSKLSVTYSRYWQVKREAWEGGVRRNYTESLAGSISMQSPPATGMSRRRRDAAGHLGCYVKMQ